MEMTEFIARIAGPYLLVTGLGFVLSTRFYVRMIAAAPNSDPVLINLSGACHFVIGLVILLHHWSWRSAEEIAVSLIGVAATAKGATLIAVPKLALGSVNGTQNRLRVIAAGFIAAGIYLVYVGYWN